MVAKYGKQNKKYLWIVVQCVGGNLHQLIRLQLNAAHFVACLTTTTLQTIQWRVLAQRFTDAGAHKGQTSA